MANEIMVLTTNPGPDGTENYDLLFFYEINPVVEVNSIVVKPTPSSGLPVIVDEFQLIAPAWKAKLDAGTFAFEQIMLTRHRGETTAQMANKARKQWAAKEPAFLNALLRRYDVTGTLVSV